MFWLLIGVFKRCQGLVPFTSASSLISLRLCAVMHMHLIASTSAVFIGSAGPIRPVNFRGFDHGDAFCTASKDRRVAGLRGLLVEMIDDEDVRVVALVIDVDGRVSGR